MPNHYEIVAPESVTRLRFDWPTDAALSMDGPPSIVSTDHNERGFAFEIVGFESDGDSSAWVDVRAPAAVGVECTVTTTFAYGPSDTKQFEFVSLVSGFEIDVSVG